MERKKIMTWLNVSAAALNATFQLLVIYRFHSGWKISYWYVYRNGDPLFHLW